MSNGAAQPPVSAFALLAGAAAAAAASAAASTALRRLPKPRLSVYAWRALLEDDEGRISDQCRCLSLAQQGVDPGLRRSAWPFLLRLLSLNSRDVERQALCSELDAEFSGLLAEAKAASSARDAQGGNVTPSNTNADSSRDNSANHHSGSSGGGDGANSSNSSSTAFTDTQRCIVMDVLRTDFDALTASGLAGEPPAAADPSNTDASAPSIECISAAAQDAINEAQYLTPEARRQAARLFNLLSVHAVHDPKLGYAQGMSDLAAVFLHVFLSNDALAFWCFERMMVGAREGFRHDECGIRRQLRQLSVLLSRADPVLHQRLKALQCADCLFAYRMVVVLLLRDLRTAEAVRLWECSWADQCLLERQAATGSGSEQAAQPGTAAAAGPSQPPLAAVGLLQAFVLAVICGERRHVLQQCSASDDVICHFATIRIRFEPTLREARRLQQLL